MGEFMKFEMLADSIKEINVKAGNIAKCAVNQLMTLRNWAIGYYIVEYEQGGSDRASYGTRLLKKLFMHQMLLCKLCFLIKKDEF